jgi:hypothetical protein
MKMMLSTYIQCLQDLQKTLSEDPEVRALYDEGGWWVEARAPEARKLIVDALWKRQRMVEEEDACEPVEGTQKTVVAVGIF